LCYNQKDIQCLKAHQKQAQVLVTMPAKRAPKKSPIKLTPKHRDRIASAALEHPNLGIRRLSSMLAREGIKVTEGNVHKILKDQKLQTRELRLKVLEERHLNEGLALSELQQRALYNFNPCLRERNLDCDRPGQLLVLDAIDFGKLKNIGRTFLNIAIDPSCFLTFAALSGSAGLAAAIALLHDHALAFFKKEGIAVRKVIVGQGVVSGGGVDPECEKFFKSQSITLTLPPAEDHPLNGFIERFKRLVGKEFLAEALRSQVFQDLETIQSSLDDWLERFNRQTQLPGYPSMGRAPMDAFEALRPTETAQEKTGKIPPPEPDLVPVLPRAAIAAAPVSPAPLAQKKYEWIPGIETWGFRAVNAALVCLIFYFGWVIASMTLYSPQIGEDPSATALLQPVEPPVSSKMGGKASPLARYHAVWDRNLFGVSRPSEKAARREKIDVDKVELAGTDVGLKLLGTVVASDPQLNSAVMEVASTRSQEILHEKERVGKAVIKLILRNTVIIETEDGRRRRLNTDDEVAKNSKPGQEWIETPKQSNVIRDDGSTLDVQRDEVPSSPSDVRSLIGDIRFAPQMVEGKMGGVSVGRLSAQNILYRMGLRSADVIKGVDDEEFDSAEGFQSFFERLAQGGDMTVLVERRGRLQKLKINIK
jgi:type II secretion system protein C